MSQSSFRPEAVLLAAVLGLASAAQPARALAANTCGQPSTTGPQPTVVDALAIVRAATGMRPCKPCVCDVDRSGATTTTDGLLVLRLAVGLEATIGCSTDCAPLCGDFVVDAPSEECDGGSETPACDPDCTSARCGDAVVNNAAGEECDDGGLSAACDADCSEPLCGDGDPNLLADEACDDGNVDSGDGCDANCTATACGNAIATDGEACDDGNLVDGDGCDSDCTPTRCGNGIVTAGEECDESGESPACDTDCTFVTCGDATVNESAGELCDDGNATDGDGCDSNCLPTGCGNAIVSAGEQCDDGNVLSGDGCDADCTETGCGNSILTAGEQCDDGNTLDGDGCDGNCTPTGCANAVVTDGEQCDDGAESAACNADCTLTECGDGIVNFVAGELCDDANPTSNDGCDSNCTPTGCGNGIATDGEACDDGGESPGCNSDCTITACGDAIVNAAAGETCEDGNRVDDDGCDSNCTPTGCGNGVVTSAEACDDGPESPLCDTDCSLALCGDGTTNAAAGETCDDGGVETAICNTDCTAAACGDSVVNATAGEECDEGGETQSCDLDCTLSVCGDAVTNATAGEACDGGGDSAACDLDCTAALCGDGRTNPMAGEICDDGNDLAGDGCEPDCTKTVICGDGTPAGAEECDDGNIVDGDGCTAGCLRERCARIEEEVRCLRCAAGMAPDVGFTTCQCQPGYELIEGACVNVDECAVGVASCPPGSPCIDLDGTYSCSTPCSQAGFEAALASCGAPTGVITFDCAETVIPLSNAADDDNRIIDCDGLVIDGLDRGISFELDPLCTEIPIASHRCNVPLNIDGTCDCPDIDNGTGFLVLLGDANIVRNLTLSGFFEGIKTAGRGSIVENVEFIRLCDDAFGNMDGGVGNVFQNLVVRRGCDKCSQNFGQITDTDDDPRLANHYNAVFRDIDFDGCVQPLRMTDGGRYLIDRCRFHGLDEPGFACTGPRFSSGTPGGLVVDFRDSELRGCRRGIRLGGHVEALVTRNTMTDSLLRGVLVSADARARLSENIILRNGGDISAEPGEGGVVVTDRARVDLGGGAVEIDGETVASNGQNMICSNINRRFAPQHVENLSDDLVVARGNFWCTTTPENGMVGAVDFSTSLDQAP